MRKEKLRNERGFHKSPSSTSTMSLTIAYVIFIFAKVTTDSYFTCIALLCKGFESLDSLIIALMINLSQAFGSNLAGLFLVGTSSDSARIILSVLLQITCSFLRAYFLSCH